MSVKIKKQLKQKRHALHSLSAPENLSYELNILRTFLCKCFVFVDYDEAGKVAVAKAIENKLIEENQVKNAIVNGLKFSEIEDCIKNEIYSEEIKNKYNVDLNVHEFRKDKNKWSKKVKKVFRDKGQDWNEAIEKGAKSIVTDCVKKNKENSLDDNRRSSIDTLVKALEDFKGDGCEVESDPKTHLVDSPSIGGSYA